ncbi:uncharacterized protein AB675_7581 [Cyphellophora attinorum]|uniref:Uncharacterized protein n=1 Tax=Cyphellophora attinorum TaxID=1664694 RepID=A0A0N1NYI9_9EURO|nr:uncharacterized protein AB675_7581 [Phialophora attinorum]KPI40236.1 hypothetical protein AB675_7581 [Phialophora attinorum]
MDPVSIIGLLETTANVVAILISLAEKFKKAPSALARVTSETEKLREQLDRFAVIRRPLCSEQQEYLDRQVSTLECRTIVQDLRDKVKAAVSNSAGSKLSYIDRAKWLYNSGEVEELVSKLAAETDRLWKLLLTEQVVSVHEKLAILQTIVAQVGLQTSSESSTFDRNGIFTPYKTSGIAWYGQFRCKPGQDDKSAYFKDRIALSDASYHGRWDEVYRRLEHAKTTHRQNWVNCTRFLSDAEHKRGKSSSGYTVLHQAAWHGKKSAVEALLKEGAWRLSRTSGSNNTPEHSTPLDVARDHKWEHLFEPLTPIIRRPVSAIVLWKLQQHLHDLIRTTFAPRSGSSLPEDAEKADDVHLECFHLPPLDVLTEFESSRLWFPLQPELKDTREGAAVHVFLERNELVAVMRWGRGDAERRTYRISTKGVQEIEQAMILR